MVIKAFEMDGWVRVQITPKRSELEYIGHVSGICTDRQDAMACAFRQNPEMLKACRVELHTREI